MSLINKMLQDLDARGGASADALNQQELKAVPLAERDQRPVMALGAVLAAAVLGAGGWYGWQYWSSHRVSPAASQQMADASQGRKILPVPGQSPAAMPAAASAPTAASVQPPVAAPVRSPAAGTASPAAAAESPQPVSTALHAAIAAEGKRHLSAAAPSEASNPRGAAGEEIVERAAPRPAKAARVANAAASSGVSGSTAQRELTPQQMSESSYRRALIALQEGRVSVAMADLDQALELYPRHDAARQTYISLLLENKRYDDAIRQLRIGLGLDPRQPGLAMVLARLQLERGGPALDTLMRTLPYAGGSAEYQAFLAGVLQREQRHAEAVEHYREALKLSPQNGVWWMGLGISLQADQQASQARDAFTHARSSGGLTPELQAFVERKLEQLAR